MPPRRSRQPEPGPARTTGAAAPTWAGAAADPTPAEPHPPSVPAVPALRARERPAAFRRLWRFYLPLAASDLLMAASEMAVNAGIARLAAPDLSLAAYGAVIATCLLIESPVIMLLHAGNALATHPQALRRLQQFTLLLAGALTALHGALAFTGLFDLYFRRTLGLDPALLAMVRPAFAVMLPWTAAIAWRRLHQGLLIRHGHTAVASRGTVIRLGTLATVMAVTGGALNLPGAVAGCAGLAAAVTAECAYVYGYARRWMNRSGWTRPVEATPQPAGREGRAGAGSPSAPARPVPAPGTAGPPAPAHAATLSWRALLGFYIPLALTSITTFAARPVLTALLARAADATLALAAWPVVWSTVLVFMLPMRTVEQVTIAHGDRDGGPSDPVRGFALRVGLGGAAAMALLAATPAAGPYLTVMVGVGGAVAAAAKAGLLAMIPVPVVVALASCEAGRLVRARRTLFIHAAAVANVAVLAGTALLVRTLAPASPGTRIAATALIAAYLAEWGVLARGARRAAQAPAGPEGSPSQDGGAQAMGAPGT
ncbi:hypothetical protein Tmar_0787 [Thermaerobacter marianensis DSM 12885]|uniref:Polysaccharide biosynthesis protein n=1 Tax=Thermaerobacter marianensis (strain ATCC 700841 / DSM 12885 / JCM 10246 / 7p75a) TaxID=644966 RepID=E6SIJ6_THEM7|nr:hypothetical protein [Thermaerobacter marianensis]ADU50902.1 hypothetical protein Tmar_0787 [Thermaerobacter marianensis DSM 12885]